MQTVTHFSGSIDEPEPTEVVRAGPSLLNVRGHICAFFHSADEEYRVLLPFIREGLELGERALHIVDPARRDDHIRRLSDAGIDIEEAIATVADDGRGFSADERAAAAGDHWGLLGMHERALEVSGSLRLRSALGQGTEVTLRVPYAASPARAGNALVMA